MVKDNPQKTKDMRILQLINGLLQIVEDIDNGGSKSGDLSIKEKIKRIRKAFEITFDDYVGKAHRPQYFVERKE